MSKAPSIANSVTTQVLGDADATIAASSTRVVLGAALTARRTAQLPPASSVAVGGIVVVADPQNRISGDNWLTIARAGSDQIGAGLSEIDLCVPGTSVVLTSDGVSRWSHTRLPRFFRYFTSTTSNWREPRGYALRRIWAISGGSGGGSGRKSSVGTAAGCGGAGANGNCIYQEVSFVSITPTTITVTIGAGGTGGASQTVTNANGNPGTSGQSTLVIASANVYRVDANNGWGGTGAGGTTSPGANGGQTSGGNWWASGTTPVQWYASNANSAAGVISAGGAVTAPGNSQYPTVFDQSGTTRAWANYESDASSYLGRVAFPVCLCGLTATPTTTADGLAGKDGITPGAGGGGGAAALEPYNSGRGGNGAPGAVWYYAE